MMRQIINSVLSGTLLSIHPFVQVDEREKAKRTEKAGSLRGAWVAEGSSMPCALGELLHRTITPERHHERANATSY